MLCTPLFRFTYSSSALLGRPRCGLSIWLWIFAIFNLPYSNCVYAKNFHEKTDKTWKYLKWYKNKKYLITCFGNSNFFNLFTPKIKMQILRAIHIGNVWVMLWELIATSVIVWAKYKMPCSPLCASYLWVEFEGRTFTLITFTSERVNCYIIIIC